MLLRALLAALVAGLAAGCSPSPVWRQVELPLGARPVSLAATGNGLLVGGQGDGPSPVLLQVAGAEVTGSLRLEAAEPYAEVAELSAVTVADDDVYAIGRATGGAHGNLRWTVWEGSLTKRVLTNRPQTFFTFGGHDAGPLLGTVVPDGDPVIVGSRTTATGAEATIWTRAGTTWHKHTGIDPVLVSTPDRVLGFSAVARHGALVLIAGNEVGLAGGLRQQPVLWAGSPAGPWRSVALPVPEELTPEPGQLSLASAVTCPEAGETCWVAGWVRGRPLVWPVIVRAGRVVAGEAIVLAGRAPTGANPVALVTRADGVAAVLTNAAEPTLQLACPGGRRTLPAPPGTATALASAGGGLYAVAGDGLWRFDAPRC